jgi:hypothetical protein
MVVMPMVVMLMMMMLMMMTPLATIGRTARFFERTLPTNPISLRNTLTMPPMLLFCTDTHNLSFLILQASACDATKVSFILVFVA